jgi:hypothetical protein
MSLYEQVRSSATGQARELHLTRALGWRNHMHLFLRFDRSFPKES